MVAEGEAALGDEDARVARLADLGDRVPHVERGQELPLLDVDDLAGLRRRDQQVGLPRQEGGDLEHVGDGGDRRGLGGLVDVGEDGAAELGLHALEGAQALGAAPGRGTS